jgi:hypothetical protein
MAPTTLPTLFNRNNSQKKLIVSQLINIITLNKNSISLVNEKK